MHWHGGGPGGPGTLRGALDDYEEVQLGKIYDQRVVTRLFKYLIPYKGLAGLGLASMLVYTFTSVATPWLVALAIGRITTGDLSSLNIIVGLFLINALVNWGAQYLQLRCMAYVSQGVLYDLRTQMFNHLHSLSLSFFDRNEVGRLMSRVQNDVLQLQEFLSQGVLSLGDLLTLGGVVIALLAMNLKLALVTFTVLPILFLFMFY